MDIRRATFETITPDKRTTTSLQGKKVLAHGVLPGENATVALVHTRGTSQIAQPIHLHTRNPHRVQPKETHYQLCSPWQIMSYTYQCQVKHTFLQEALHSIDPSYTSSFIPSPTTLGYRTAIGYGFTTRQGKVELAMRGHEKTTALPHGCLLASSRTNTVAERVRDILQETDLQASSLLRLVLRESKTSGKVLAALYTYDTTFPTLSETVLSSAGLSGFTVFHTDPKETLPQPTLELFHWGDRSLSETILSLLITYPATAFFQNNIPLYEQVLTDIKEHLEPCEQVVDTYAGVGTIGLSLAPIAMSVTSIETSASMTEYTQQNAKMNHLSNVTAHALAAESLDDSILSSADVVIVNPTRKGLHQTFVEQLLRTRPQQIAYVSCNIGTLKRDLTLLAPSYSLTFAQGYDFYPHTPHQESLVILRAR